MLWCDVNSIQFPKKLKYTLKVGGDPSDLICTLNHCFELPHLLIIHASSTNHIERERVSDNGGMKCGSFVQKHVKLFICPLGSLQPSYHGPSDTGLFQMFIHNVLWRSGLSQELMAHFLSSYPDFSFQKYLIKYANIL